MAIKFTCDICDRDVPEGNIRAEYISSEANPFKGNKQPLLSKYMFCVLCHAEMKNKIVELINTKRKEENEQNMRTV